MEEWPWEAITTAAGLALTNLALLFRGLYRLLADSSASQARMHELGWERVAELEQETKLLRIALHKANVRSNVRLTISEMLVLAMPLPLEARIQAVKQAREIAEQSLPERPS